MQTPLINHGHLRPGAPACARLGVVCGCMFSGKTEALIDRILAWPAERVQVFKHAADDRYHKTRVVSHRRRSCAATPVTQASEVLQLLGKDTAFVAIDEGHFFDAHLPVACRWLAECGVNVVVAALDRDSWGRPFPMIERLGQAAETVTVKSARCGRCGGKATRTQRLTPIVGGRIVGGAESFEPRCPQCWMPPPESPDQITRAASKTGPSVQQSSYRQPSAAEASRTGTTHDWQVPVPQAIDRSIHT